MQYLTLLVFVPLVALIKGDFRTREISLLCLLLLGVVSLCTSIVSEGFSAVLYNVICNLLLLIYLGAGVVVYCRIREGKWVNPLNCYAGAGDLIFMLAITPLFDLRGYVIFLIASLVFSLMWMAVVRLLSRRAETVPLVGTMGLTLGISLIVKLLIWPIFHV